MATNGYKSLAFGVKSRGMGGVGVAFPQDAIVAANNPAGMAWVGNRLDIGVDFFNPNRDAELAGIEADSRRNWFLIPEFGYNHMIDDRLSVGVSLVGNGGMNTSYDKNIFDRVIAAQLGLTKTGTPDTGNEVGVDLAQLLILPTVAYKVNPNHSIGASVVLGIQKFEAYGLGNFQCFTQTGATNPSCQTFGPLAPAFDPNFVFSDALTDNGKDYAFGAGVRIGWLGRFTDQVSVGISYATKVYMQEFEDYEELFAEQGDFDIPAILQAGIAVKALPNLIVAFDYERIFYSDVASISNPGPILAPNPFPEGTGPLGTDDGLGFGWEDQDVFKLGAAYDINDRWTVRAGYAYGESPIPDDQILFNILAPAVVEHHVTVGFTYKLSKNSELSGAYMHAFENEQSQEDTLLGPAEISMNQNSFSIGYGMTF
jgi:long-chain fatty acid transport protein